jgi:hypothetical protein
LRHGKAAAEEPDGRFYRLHDWTQLFAETAAWGPVPSRHNACKFKVRLPSLQQNQAQPPSISNESEYVGYKYMCFRAMLLLPLLDLEKLLYVMKPILKGGFLE